MVGGGGGGKVSANKNGKLSQFIMCHVCGGVRRGALLSASTRLAALIVGVPMEWYAVYCGVGGATGSGGSVKGS